MSRNQVLSTIILIIIYGICVVGDLNHSEIEIFHRTINRNKIKKKKIILTDFPLTPQGSLPLLLCVSDSQYLILTFFLKFHIYYFCVVSIRILVHT